MPFVDEAARQALHRRRHKARNWALGGFGVAFLGGLLLSLRVIAWRSAVEGGDAWWLDAEVLVTWVGGGVLLAGLAVFLVASIAWAAFAYQAHRKDDPWAYDPELDGPDPKRRRGLEDVDEEAP